MSSAGKQQKTDIKDTSNKLRNENGHKKTLPQRLRNP